MTPSLKFALTCIYTDFLGWSTKDRLWLLVAVLAVGLASIGGTWLEGVTALTNVVCVLLVAKGRLSNFYWGLVGVVSLMVVAWGANLYGTAILNAVFIVAQVAGWWMWQQSMSADGVVRDVEVRRINWRVILPDTRGYATGVVLCWVWIYVMYNGLLAAFFADHGSPYPHSDAAVLLYSLMATVLMTFRFAEQWIFWTMSNILCIYMWVIPVIGGEGSLSIVVMWTVFLINSLYGLYKWYIVKENK